MNDKMIKVFIYRLDLLVKRLCFKYLEESVELDCLRRMNIYCQFVHQDGLDDWEVGPQLKDNN